MDDVIAIEVDAGGIVRDVHGPASDLLGSDVAHLIGRHLSECVNPSDTGRLQGGIDLDATPSATDSRSSVVLRLLDDSGRSIWVDLVVAERRAESERGSTVLHASPFRRVEPATREVPDPYPYHALVQRSADILMVVDPDGTVRFVNTAMLRLLGMEPDDLIGSQVLDIIHPDDHDDLTDIVARLLEHPDDLHKFEFRTRHVDGTYRWIDGWLQNLLDHPGVGGLLGNGRDVTDRHQAQAALAASEERFRSLASSSPSAIFELDASGTVRFANERWRAITGRSLAETTDVFSVLIPSDAQRLRTAWNAGSFRSGLDDNVRVVRPDGGVRWVELHTRPVAELDDTAATHVGSLHDVTEIHRAHSELEYLATHDPLTGLPNRHVLTERLGGAAARAARTGELFALLFVDLDRFKVVNDSLGHHAGDEVLTAVTARLGDLVRPDDVVARFGGDEFVVLCDPIADPDQAVALADRIRREVSGGVEVDGETVHVSVSVGVVIGNGDSAPEMLLRDADAAMYAAKTRGRDRAQVFDEAMHRAAMERLSVEAGLRRGLQRGEFRLLFQPIVDVDSGAVGGVEALVRWQHPERGLLEPVDFLAVAEESGVLRELGPWVLEDACGHAAGWTTGASGPDLFVNLAAVQMANRHLLEVVGQVLSDTGFDGSRLVLEVTEGMLMTDADETAVVLRSLRELGVRIAIDDFGTGYSSLSYLTRLPVDVLKIDQSFVSGLDHSPKDREVTGAIVALAHALGLQTVAEGVENAGQLAALADLGCDLAQGFWFSSPVRPEAIPALMRGESG